VNLGEEERETLIENEVGKRLIILLPIFFSSFFFLISLYPIVCFTKMTISFSERLLMEFSAFVSS